MRNLLKSTRSCVLFCQEAAKGNKIIKTESLSQIVLLKPEKEQSEASRLLTWLQLLVKFHSSMSGEK